MADIFVCYRRDDSQWSAGRIGDHLVHAFGHDRVFFDTITVEPGEDFHEVIGAQVGACKVLLAVIGPNWLDTLERGSENLNDFVRIEIAEALRRDVRVVPVLIDGAQPPAEARLPKDLQPLARRSTVTVSADKFRHEAEQLSAFLKRFLDGAPPAPAAAEGRAADSAGPGPTFRERWAGGRALQAVLRPATERVGEPPNAGSKALAPVAAGLTPGRAGEIPVLVGIKGREEARRFVPGGGKSEWFRDFDTAPEMVVVPAGEFLMGSPEGEVGSKDSERPRHRVTIAQPFAVGRFAVTFAEWDAALSRGGVKHNPGDRGWGRALRPVIDVSWNDAQAYVTWLSREAGKHYRLLSEAEWEYCCRAGTDTPFWWGTSIFATRANYEGNYTYGGGSKGVYREQTVPVNSFAANPWGLFQMHGNVYEWCADNWHPDYHGSPPDDGGIWLGGDASLRVLRGGSWGSYPHVLRSAHRGDHFGPDRHSSWVGFRVARTLSPPTP